MSLLVNDIINEDVYAKNRRLARRIASLTLATDMLALTRDRAICTANTAVLANTTDHYFNTTNALDELEEEFVEVEGHDNYMNLIEAISRV